ncbi:MAG: ferritin [Methermicoccaceae archaeon]
MDQKLVDAINKQINAELYSGYMYLSMSAYLDANNLPGIAHWMKIQAIEEYSHAMRLYNYIVERGDVVKLFAIEQPPTEWKSIIDVFEKTYEHEVKVTGMINDLMTLAIKKGDYATQNMLQWFVEEQVEEESSADEILQKLRRIGDDGRGLLMIDAELGARQPPVSMPIYGPEGE